MNAMNWRLLGGMMAALLLLANGGPLPAQVVAPGAAGIRSDRILVKPKPGMDLAALHTLLGTQVLRNFPGIGNLQIVQLPAGGIGQEIISRFQLSGQVEYAEPDFIVKIQAEPNDFRYADGSLWSLHNTGINGGVPGADIDAPAGWDTQKTADNVIVAVIDTGVRFTHEDLATNMWTNPGESGRNALGLDKGSNALDDDNDGFIDDVHGINAILGIGLPLDDHGHGTHLAGIIGGAGNNSVGMAGVCWRVQLMACKFLDAQGHGSLSDAITCIDYARRKGAKIINASWGDYSYNSTALRDAINSARLSGIIFVAACGNDNINNDTNPLYPASFKLDNIVAVAATTRADDKAAFSNYGATNVHLGAPGDPIFSCWNGSDSDYRYLSGTSMAAPHVAGVCALVWARYPSDNYRQVIDRVLAGTEPLPALADKCVTGGRLNLPQALSASPGVVANFTATPTSGTAPLSVRLTNVSTGPVVGWQWSFGDGSPGSTNENPVHVFDNAGTFVVTLTVSSTAGATSSKSQTIQASAPSAVTADFTASPSSGPAPLIVQFTDRSAGDIAGWFWDFGDGMAGSADRNPGHVYAAPGTFTARLTVTASNGSTSARSQAIRVTTLLMGANFAAAAVEGGAPPMNQFQFQIRGHANDTYLIQSSTDLVHWTVIATNEAAADGTVTFTDAQAGLFKQRFYRGLRLNVAAAGAPNDRILVKPKLGLDLSALHQTLGVQVLHTFSGIGNLQILQVPLAITADALILLYQQSGLVAYAEHDFTVHALVEPNDFRFTDGSLWNFKNVGQLGGVPDADIDAPEAWDTLHDANNVVVAVIDTGIRATHEDLAQNLWTNPGEIAGNGLDDDGDGYVDDVHGINTLNSSGNPEDDYGHGSHVAGIIGGAGNNSVGVAGVCWKVQMMACKFLNPQGDGAISDAIKCIDYARTKGARVINASWGNTTFTSQALQDTIVSARNADIIFVAASGNSSGDNDNPASAIFPASQDPDNIIAVAATTRTDALADFSNYGATKVDLAAPGTPIFSCWNGSDSDYQYLSGTSMAAAHVTGAIALLRAQHPNESYLSIINRLLGGVDPVPALAGKCRTGGRLNLAKALGSVPPPPPTNGLPVITLSEFDPNASESGPDVGAIRFHRTGDTSQAIQVSWAFSGSAVNGFDFQQLPTSSPFPAGLAEADLTITTIDDMEVEGNETVIVTLVAGPGYTVGSPNTATVTIADNDQPPPPPKPTVAVAATDANAAESGDTGTFTISRSESTTAALTVSYALSGTAQNSFDYQQLSGSVTIAAGASSAAITVMPVDDSAVEANETVVLTLSANAAYTVGSPNTATVTIADNDQAPRPIVSISVTIAVISEGGGPATCTIRRTGSTFASLTVRYSLSGTAVNGTDYERLSGTAIIPAGADSVTVAVRPIDDRLIELAELAVLTLEADASYDVDLSLNAAIITITDNDLLGL